MKQLLKLLDVVVLDVNLPEEDLERGMIGTIVEILDEKREIFLVEFSDESGEAYAMLEHATSQLLKLHRRSVAA